MRFAQLLIFIVIVILISYTAHAVMDVANTIQKRVDVINTVLEGK